MSILKDLGRRGPAYRGNGILTVSTHVMPQFQALSFRRADLSSATVSVPKRRLISA